MLSGRERSKWEVHVSSPGSRRFLGVFEGGPTAAIRNPSVPALVLHTAAALWAQAQSNFVLHLPGKVGAKGEWVLHHLEDTPNFQELEKLSH